MASQEIQQAIQSYENYISDNGIDESVIDAMIEACKVAYQTEKDIPYALKVSERTKELIEQFVLSLTGTDIWGLEKYSFENKVKYEIIDKFYEVLLLEAQNKIVDSGFRYLERKREPKERFYMPRRKQFLKISLVDALQGMIDDKYDILCMSLIPGAGKTTIEKFLNALVIGWFPKDFTLFYSHSGDITRMYYDGVYDIVTNTDEYTWNEIFPDLHVTSTNAKMEQFNVGKYKPYMICDKKEYERSSTLPVLCFFRCCGYEIDPDTLCEYTGLTDKNGKKIWENDILKAHLDESYPEDITYTKILWNECRFCTNENYSMDIETLGKWDAEHFQVCGNIFDNPELLEVK